MTQGKGERIRDRMKVNDTVRKGSKSGLGGEDEEEEKEEEEELG